MTRQSADILITNASQILTLGSAVPGPHVGDAMDDLGVVEGGSLAIAGERILAVGSADRVRGCVAAGAGTLQIDATGKLVMPGFVDAHTHPVFGGSRELEFEMRLRGKTYAEIQQEGGGIRATVQATRGTPADELSARGRERLDRMLRWGTTTVEAKSGYGLSAQSEVKILEIIRELDRTHPVDLVPTFLGAHDYPEEFASDHDGYLRVLTEVMIPLVANAGLAEFCDVFCDQGFFSAEESEQVLACGSKLGLRPKLHADELTSAGGAELAGRIGAVSADHVLHPSEEGLAAMRARAVVAVLLPGTSLSLRSGRYAPARRMIEMGIPVALGTDLNPGTCTIESLPLIIGLSCLQMGLTPAEAITASTINAAWAVGRGDRIGSLEPGKQADVLVLDVPNYRMIAYQFSVAHTELVIKRGTVAYAR